MSRPLRFARAYWAIGLAYVAFIIYLSLIPNPPKGPDVPFVDKWEHFGAYGLMMGWFAQLVPGRAGRLKLALIFTLLGGLIEILQGMGGVRMAEWSDFFADGVGVVLGYGISSGTMGNILQGLEELFFHRKREH